MIDAHGSLLYRPVDAIELSAVHRVLVVMLRHHGDVLLTSPVLSALHDALPHAKVDVLLYEETAALLEHNPHVAKLFTIDRRWKEEGAFGQILSEWRLLHRLEKQGYDLLIHLSNHRRGAWLARWLRPRYSIAARPRNPSRFWKGSFTHLYPNGSSVVGVGPLARRHTVEQNLDALRRLGIRVDPSPRLTLVPGPAGERAAEEFLESHHVAGPYILIQPTSRWMFKCWPARENAQLIRQLLLRGHTVLLSCAPDEREQAMVRAILANFSERPARLILATDGSTLLRLAALIGRARLFIGIDSAPMHIAAAMQTPTVALFGPSGEYNWGPWRGDGQLKYRVVASTEFSCRPCGQDGCGGSKVSDCLTRLPVSQVLSAVDEVLRESDLLFAS
ncbi:MAG: putative lipopolysaccharide heptosyltransferase III [Burkholderiaceae bacterium]|jgi:heptosyltransferase-3